MRTTLIRYLLKDPLIILAVCFSVPILRTLIFHGFESFNQSAFNGVLLIAGAYFIFCYPIWSITLTRLRSPKIFALCILITLSISVGLSLDWGENLSYKVGNIDARVNGNFTLFGLFYQFVCTPLFVFLLWGIYLIFRDKFRQNEDKN